MLWFVSMEYEVSKTKWKITFGKKMWIVTTVSLSVVFFVVAEALMAEFVNLYMQALKEYQC